MWVAGVLASAAAMDKDVMKRLCKESGIPVVDHMVAMRGSIDREGICRRLLGSHSSGTTEPVAAQQSQGSG